jgi:hypothetical protein
MAKHKVIPNPKVQVVMDNDPKEVQAAKIKAESQVKEAGTPKGTVAPATSLRERILSLSLFPNPYNKSMVSRYEKD